MLKDFCCFDIACMGQPLLKWTLLTYLANLTSSVYQVDNSVLPTKGQCINNAPVSPFTIRQK